MTGKPCPLDAAQRARAFAALKAMPARARGVFILHRFEGWDYGRIAGHTGLSHRQIEKALCKAMARLHKALDREGR